MTVREMLYHALQGYVRTDITSDFVEVNDALDTLTPPVEALVEELSSNPDLNDCWADEDADGKQTRCGFTDLPLAEWCWPCRANAALAPFLETP